MVEKLRGYVRRESEILDMFNYCKVYVIKTVPFCDDVSSPYQKVKAFRRYLDKKTNKFIDQKREYNFGVQKKFKVIAGDIIYFDSTGYPGVISTRDSHLRMENVEIIDYGK